MIHSSAKWLAEMLWKWPTLNQTAESAALWCLVAPSGGSSLLPHPTPPNSAHLQRELTAGQV